MSCEPDELVITRGEHDLVSESLLGVDEHRASADGLACPDRKRERAGNAGILDLQPPFVFVPAARELAIAEQDEGESGMQRGMPRMLLQSLFVDLARAVRADQSLKAGSVICGDERVMGSDSIGRLKGCVSCVQVSDFAKQDAAQVLCLRAGGPQAAGCSSMTQCLAVVRRGTSAGVLHARHCLRLNLARPVQQQAGKLAVVVWRARVRRQLASQLSDALVIHSNSTILAPRVGSSGAPRPGRRTLRRDRPRAAAAARAFFPRRR
jgi:hypothetical protein